MNMFENGEPVRNPYAGMHQCQISHDTQGAYRNRVPLAKKKLVEAEGLNSGGGSEARELIGDAYALFHSVDGYPFMEPFDLKLRPYFKVINNDDLYRQDVHAANLRRYD